MENLAEADQARLSQALNQLRLGAWDEARTVLAGIEFQDHPLVLANLAFTEEKLGHLETARASYERALSLAPLSAELRFNWGNFLAQHATPQEARDQWLAALTLDPGLIGAWINLGVNLLESSHPAAARTAFQAALAIQIDHPAAQLNLAQVALRQQENGEAADLFQRLLTQEPLHREAHRGLATALTRLGQDEAAAPHRDLAWQGQPTFFFPGSRHAQHQMLVLASAHEGNVPWQNLVDRHNTHVRAIALEYFPDHERLPSCDLLFNAVGDPDRSPLALKRAQHYWPDSGSRRNDPWRVAATARTALPQHLQGISGLRLARCEAYPRQHDNPAEEAARLRVWMSEQGWSFPLLLRSGGFHGGQFFDKVNHPDDLAPTLARLPGTHLLVIEWLPSQDADGFHRKYRLMSLGGLLCPLHLAISPQWKVHYFSADMAKQPAHREEEARFLEHFTDVLPAPALHALNQVQERLGLDYGGMDFALDRDGHVLLFEANATMIMAAPPEDALWDYRREAYEQALEQARAVFLP